jgi:tryptophanyl-tRNA synthetase
VYAIHRLFKSEDELAPLYEEHKGKYKALKEALVEDIDAALSPLRERRNAISDADVAAVLKEGSDKARAVASAKMRDVREKVGVLLS